MKFSIRAILIVTTLVGVLVAIFVAPTVVASALIVCLWPLATTALIGVAIYSRDAFQAFAIGASVPVVIFSAMLALLGLGIATD